MGAAKGRTSDGLGTKYPVISEQLWTARAGRRSAGRKSPQGAQADGRRSAAAERTARPRSGTVRGARTTRPADGLAPRATGRGGQRTAAGPGIAAVAGATRTPQWLAWAFLLPVGAYLCAFYAYPLYRNIDLSVRHYTVRSFVQGGAPFSGLGQRPPGRPRRHLLHRAAQHDGLHLVSIVFQYALGLALAVFFHRGFRLAPTLRALFLIPGCCR